MTRQVSMVCGNERLQCCLLRRSSQLCSAPYRTERPHHPRGHRINLRVDLLWNSSFSPLVLTPKKKEAGFRGEPQRLLLSVAERYAHSRDRVGDHSAIPDFGPTKFLLGLIRSGNTDTALRI